MPFTRPTLTELVTRTEADLASRLGTGPLLEKSVLKVLARVMAGATHLEHGHLEFIAGQVVWDTAEAEYLERWADIWGLTRKPATFSQGLIEFTGTEGTAIPAGTTVSRSDGAEFAADSAGEISGGTASVACTAKVAGAAGNTATATVLSITSPVSGLDPTSTAGPLGLSGGADEESDPDFLARFLLDRRQPPTGGSKSDYVGWALEVAGVTRAWCLPEHQGAGTVGITFAVDAETSPVPDPAKVAEVQVKIDAERPVAVKQSLVFAPFEQPLDFQAEILPNTPEVRASITTALEELVLREAEPGGTLLISKIREAIATAAGELNHNLVSPVADVTVQAGELSIIGTVSLTSFA